MKTIFYNSSTKTLGSGKNSKHQAPSTREASSFKLQGNEVRVLELGSWNFSGAWMLVLGAFSVAVFSAAPLSAQENPLPARSLLHGKSPATNAVGGYASDITVVSDAQQQALDQARQMLAQSENANEHSALDTAIKAMERAQAALEQAKKSPEKLPAAIAAEQAAYQALLKATPREFRIQRSRNGAQNQGNSSGQPNQRQFDQLEMANEQNRYETERQAAAAPNAQQREQTQVADRLKELAQRQQDLNDRLDRKSTRLNSVT